MTLQPLRSFARSLAELGRAIRLPIRSAPLENAEASGSLAQIGRDDAAQHAHHQQLTDSARDRHDALTTAIERLEHALAEAASLREHPWSERVASEFERVRWAIRSHVDGVEEPEGLFDEIQAVAPRLSKRVAALRKDHMSLIARGSALADTLADDSKVDIVRLRRRAGVLLTDLKTHRALEADLIYEAFWLELGGGD